jgi:hypothetical protein
LPSEGRGGEHSPLVRAQAGQHAKIVFAASAGSENTRDPPKHFRVFRVFCGSDFDSGGAAMPRRCFLTLERISCRRSGCEAPLECGGMPAAWHD